MTAIYLDHLKWWPIIVGICIALIGYGGSLAVAKGTQEDVEKLQATYVTKEVLDLKLKPLQMSLGRIERKLKIEAL